MEYEINKGTLAIMPNEVDTSLVYEDEERFLVHQSPFQIMEDSCKYFGSTYEGRKDSARSILGAEYKVPVIVEDTDNLIVFPTTSPKSDDCIWISLKRVKSDCNFKPFFLNYAKIWCTKARPEYTKLLLTIDVHGPAYYRANMQVRNFSEFYQAFDIKESDKMYLAPEKRLIIW